MVSKLLLGILIAAAGTASAVIIVSQVKKQAAPTSQTPGTNTGNIPFPSGSFKPSGQGPTSGTTTPTTPTVTPPQPNPNLAPVQITVQAPNGNYQTFIVTADDFNALMDQLNGPNTLGYIANSIQNPGPAVNSTMSQVLAYLQQNQIAAEVIPNLQFDLQAHNGNWLKGVILTQNDWTVFRANFPTGIGVYNVVDTNVAENTTISDLTTFLNNNQ